MLSEHSRILHPTSCKIGTGSPSRGGGQPGCGVDHPPQSSTEVKGKVELYVYSRLGLSWPLLSLNLPLAYTLVVENMYLVFLVRILKSELIACVVLLIKHFICRIWHTYCPVLGRVIYSFLFI